MKPVIVTLAMLLVAMVIGCRDDSSMNPLANQEPILDALAWPPPTTDIILPLQGILEDPDPRYRVTNIRGQVVARFEGNGRLCNLTLRTDAELWGPSTNNDERWKVAGSTCDQIKLPTEWARISFCKDYRIQGRSDRIQLCVDFYILWKPGINFRTIYLEGIHIEKRLPGPDPNNW